MSVKAQATSFEGRIVKLLDKMGFFDVDGARDDFIINGHQVDAVGGYDKTLLIVECTMKINLGKKKLKSKIAEFKGKYNDLVKGFRDHPTYKKYTRFRLVFATKNINVSSRDIKFANNPEIVYVWDDNLIDYYEDLQDKLKEFSKFNLLGEMGIRPSPGNNISVPAFKTKVGGHTMFSFLINPRDLLEFSYVARRETKNERFYQRLIKKDQIKKIAEYVDSGQLLPNNIIIAFNKELKKYVKFHTIHKDHISKTTSGIAISYGVLEFPRDYRSCWIIDGQHRLYSFIHSEKNIEMPIVAFKNLDVEDQARIFLDINKYQKPVPPDLLWDLNGNMIPNEDDGKISNLVKGLNGEGPLKYKIYIPSEGIKKKRNILKIASLCTSISKVGLVKESTISKTTNPFYSRNPQTLISNLSRGLNEYLMVVEETFPEDWKLKNKGFVLSKGGLSVMIAYFEKIVSRMVGKGTPTNKDYKMYLEPLKQIIDLMNENKSELKSWKSRTASFGGRKEVLKEFMIYAREKTGDTHFGGPDIEESELEIILEIERKLKEFLKVQLHKKFGAKWFDEEIIPKEVRGRAISRAKQQGNPEEEAYKQLNFGECIELLRRNKKELYPLLMKSKYGFSNNSEIDAAMSNLSKMRTQKAHPIKLKQKMYQESLFKIYSDKMKRTLDELLSE